MSDTTKQNPMLYLRDPKKGWHEECAVVGVNGIPRAAEMAYMALYALQHRGQESSGIVSSGKASMLQHKGPGLVAEVFNPQALEGLTGFSAVGHNRYSTSGGSRNDNIQPLKVTCQGGEIALAHNGQLVDADNIRKRMEAKGSIFQTTADSEIILHYIASSTKSTVEERILEAFQQVDGAFSITMLVGETVYAVRDPHGFRPLVLGALDNGAIVASETCALDIVDATFTREVEPGEIVALENGTVRTVAHLKPAGLHKCVFELIYFARPDSTVFGESVDRVRRRMGRRLAEEHPVDADCVIAVPDSSNSAALGYAEASGLPFELGLIRNHYIGRTFIRPGQGAREAGVRVKYNMVKSILEGKRVIMVDDSIVRGTTSRKLVKLLRKGGVKEIHFRVASPPVVGPCYYGIDTPSHAELIAANHSLEDICSFLGVDSLGYLSEEGVQTCVQAPSEYCYACFTNTYPIPPTGDQAVRSQEAEPVGSRKS